eukprot:Rhum_TRINITY_DN14298_c19_g1::Rhum_TRINITY_DN14298_c19_g1_i1::g.73336::m.73336
MPQPLVQVDLTLDEAPLPEGVHVVLVDDLDRRARLRLGVAGCVHAPERALLQVPGLRLVVGVVDVAHLVVGQVDRQLEAVARRQHRSHRLRREVRRDLLEQVDRQLEQPGVGAGSAHAQGGSSGVQRVPLRGARLAEDAAAPPAPVAPVRGREADAATHAPRDARVKEAHAQDPKPLGLRDRRVLALLRDHLTALRLCDHALRHRARLRPRCLRTSAAALVCVGSPPRTYGRGRTLRPDALRAAEPRAPLRAVAAAAAAARGGGPLLCLRITHLAVAPHTSLCVLLRRLQGCVCVYVCMWVCPRSPAMKYRYCS